jgi:predicted aspartyl protease
MRTLKHLMNDYLSISKQLAYYVGARNASQVAKYTKDQRVAAVKLTQALIAYQGITVEELEQAKEWAANDAT